MTYNILIYGERIEEATACAISGGRCFSLSETLNKSKVNLIYMILRALDIYIYIGLWRLIIVFLIRDNTSGSLSAFGTYTRFIEDNYDDMNLNIVAGQF